MKRAFAILVVLLLAVGMIGLFFASFLTPGAAVTGVQTTEQPQAQAPAQTAPAQTPDLNNLAQ